MRENNTPTLIALALALCFMGIMIAIKKPFSELVIVFVIEIIAFILGREFHKYELFLKEWYK